MAFLDRESLRERLEETLQRSRDDTDRQLEALHAEARGIQTWLQDMSAQLELLAVTVEDGYQQGGSDVTGYRQTLQRLQHTIREHQVPVQVVLQKGKRHLDHQPDVCLQTELKNIQYFWDLLQGKVSYLQEALGEGAAPPQETGQPQGGGEGGTMCDNRQNQDDGLGYRKSDTQKPSHRRIVERSTKGLIAAVEKLQHRTDALTGSGSSIGTQQTTSTTMNQSNPISISHGGWRVDNLTRELSSSDESLNELMLDVNEYMASLVELENSSLDDDGYGSFGKKGLEFYSQGQSAENLGKSQDEPESPRVADKGACGFSSEEDLDEAVSSLEDLHMSWECLSASPPSLPAFYHLPQPKHSTPRHGRAETQDTSQERPQASRGSGDEEKGGEGGKEGLEEGRSGMEESRSANSSLLTLEITDSLPEAIKEQFECFAEDLRLLSEFLENMTEQAAIQSPGDDLVSLQVFLEKHLAFKMQMDTNSVLRSSMLREGHQLAGTLSTQRSALEGVLNTIEGRWAQLVRAVKQQHRAISGALESIRMDLAAPTGEGANGEDLKEAVAMETAQDAMEEMSLKLSGSGVSDSPTDIKVNSVMRFHLEELAEESWDLLSSSPEDSLLLSPHGSPPGAHSYELSDFQAQHAELSDWLGEIEGVLTDRDDLMMSEEQIKHLCKSYEIEMGLYQRRRDSFLQKGERLKAAYPDLFSDISDKLLAITKKWDLLRVNLAHEGGITPPGENEMVLAALEASIEHLQAWLSDMEAKMFVNDIYNISGVEDLEVRLKQHEALQLDIEAHAPSIASVLELCEKLEDDCQACRTYEEKEALQLAAINLERRWDAICMQAIDMQCRLEERLCTYRQGLYQPSVGRYDLSSSASTLSEVATGSNDTSLDLEDFHSDADVIPFDAGEYESIVHRGGEHRKTRKQAACNFQTESTTVKQRGERGLSHSDGDVRPKKRTPKKYTDQRHSTCSLNPYREDPHFNKNRRSTNDLGPQKPRRPSKELYFNKQTKQNSPVASAIVTLDSEVMLEEDQGETRDDNLFATIKGILVDRTMSLDEGLNFLGVVEIHTVPRTLNLSKRELFSRIAGHLMSSALLTQSDTDLLKAPDRKSKMAFPLVASDAGEIGMLEAGAGGAEFAEHEEEEEMYHSRESGIASDHEAFLLSLEDDRLREQQDELDGEFGWYHGRDVESGSDPEFLRNVVHEKGEEAVGEGLYKSTDYDYPAESSQSYHKYGLSDRTLEILQEVMDTTSPFVSKLRQQNGSKNASEKGYEEDGMDEREGRVDVASLLLSCYEEENAADSMEWDSGMSSYECTPLSTLAYSEEGNRGSDRGRGKSRRHREEERHEEEGFEDAATAALFAVTDDCPAEYAIQGIDLDEPNLTINGTTNEFGADEQCKRTEEGRKYLFGRYGNGLLGNGPFSSVESRVSGVCDTSTQGEVEYGRSGSTGGLRSPLHRPAGTLSSRKWQFYEEEMTSRDVLWQRGDDQGIWKQHPSTGRIRDVDYRGPMSGVPTSPDKHSGRTSGAAEFITAPGDNGYHTEAACRTSFVTTETRQAGAGCDRRTSEGSGDGDSDGRMTDEEAGNGSAQRHQPLLTSTHLPECDTRGSAGDAGMVVQNVYNNATEVVARGDILDQFASGYTQKGAVDGSGMGGFHGDGQNFSSLQYRPGADLRRDARPSDSGDAHDSAVSNWDRVQASSDRSIPYHSSNTRWTQPGIVGNHNLASASAKFEDDEMFRRFQSIERELLAEDDFLALPSYSRRFDSSLTDGDEDDSLQNDAEHRWYPPSGDDLELMEKEAYKQINDLASSGAILEETTKNLKELLNGFSSKRASMDASGSDSDASTVKDADETTTAVSGSRSFLSAVEEHGVNGDVASGPKYEHTTPSCKTGVQEDSITQQSVANRQHVKHETLQAFDGSLQTLTHSSIHAGESQNDFSHDISNGSGNTTGTRASVGEEVPCVIPDAEVGEINLSHTKVMDGAKTTEGHCQDNTLPEQDVNGDITTSDHQIKEIPPSYMEVLDTGHNTNGCCADSKQQHANGDVAVSDPGCFGRRRIVPRKIPLRPFVRPLSPLVTADLAKRRLKVTCVSHVPDELDQDHPYFSSTGKAVPLQQTVHENNAVTRDGFETSEEIQTNGLYNGRYDSRDGQVYMEETVDKTDGLEDSFETVKVVQTNGICNGGHNSHVGPADMGEDISPPSYEQACQEAQEVGQQLVTHSEGLQSESSTTDNVEQLSSHGGQTDSFRSTSYNNSVQEVDYVSSRPTEEGVSDTQSDHTTSPGVVVLSDASVVNTSVSTYTKKVDTEEQDVTSSAFTAVQSTDIVVDSSFQFDSRVCERSDNEAIAKDALQLDVPCPAVRNDGALVLSDVPQGGDEVSSAAFCAGSELDRRMSPSGLYTTSQTTSTQHLTADTCTTTRQPADTEPTQAGTEPTQAGTEPTQADTEPTQADTELTQAGSELVTAELQEENLQLHHTTEVDGKTSSSSLHQNGALPQGRGDVAEGSKTGSLKEAPGSASLGPKEWLDKLLVQSGGSSTDGGEVRELSDKAQHTCEHQENNVSPNGNVGEAGTGLSTEHAEGIPAQSCLLHSDEGTIMTQRADLSDYSKNTLSVQRQQLHTCTAVQSVRSSHEMEVVTKAASSHTSLVLSSGTTQGCPGSNLPLELGPQDGSLPPPQVELASQQGTKPTGCQDQVGPHSDAPDEPTRCQDQVGLHSDGPDDLLLPCQQSSGSGEADMSGGGVPCAEPPAQLIRRRKPETAAHRQQAAEHMAISRVPQAEAPPGADYERRPLPWLQRMMRLALPVQLVLFVLFLLVVFLPLVLEPECCTTANNLHRSIHPTLRHTGPSPT